MKFPSCKLPLLNAALPLVTIKVLHTAVWLFFVGRVLAIPRAENKGENPCAAELITAVLIECAILAFNGGRWPLTDLAKRYTDERRYKWVAFRH